MSIYAIDFDGTLCNSLFPKIGKEKTDIVNYVKQLQADGNKIILWTCREGKQLDEAIAWCNERNIFFDGVNENLADSIDRFENDSRKVYADYYIDDKNIKLEDINDAALTTTYASAKGGEYMRKFWFTKLQANAAKRTLELYFYGEIYGGLEYDYATDSIKQSETSADHVRKEIEAYGDIEVLEVHINSMGGSVKEANAIINMIRRLKCETVAYVDAFACSAASALACACKKVLMARNTVMMIHNPAWEVYGNAKVLRKSADDLEIIGEAFLTTYLDKSAGKISREQLAEMLDAETYLTAEQAFDIGLCDEIEEFDAVMQEPDVETKQAAAKVHVDIGRVCAMVRGELHAHAETKPSEPAPKEPQAKEEPEEEPEQLPEIPDRSEFEAKAEALIFNFIK